jgi:mono/diheme cytochrome c family protein
VTKRVLIAALIAGACSVVGAACGSSSSDGTSTAAPAASSAAAPAATAASTAAATTAAGSTEDNGGGGGATGDAAAGKAVFTANCGSCHTLKDAGTTGSVGPDLDQLKPSFDVVEHQVENGGGVMPAFEGTLSDSDIANVSAYVSSVAGQ